jgi:GT2 family glycosyltransferase
MKVSVIVLTWNGVDYVEACLEAVLAQAPPPFEVIVVDNASTDGTPDLVTERFPGVQLIRNSRNLGFAAGNNVGLRAATGEVLVLLNQDTLVHPGLLSALAEAFEKPPVGLAGCKLLYPDGTIQHAGGYLHGPRGETEHVGRLEADDGRFDAQTDPEFVTGAAIGISRQALAHIGLLDEGFSPAYYEDVDWCFRARAAGWRVVYVPNAVATHYEGASADHVSYSHIMSGNYGRVRFLLKHWPLDRLLDEFGPAEADWVAALPRVTWLMAARGAYLRAWLDLPGILAFRSRSNTEAQALTGLLAGLRAAAITSLETETNGAAQGDDAAALQQIAPGQVPSSPPSSPPSLGDRLHRLWTGFRYLDVLPDLVGLVGHVQHNSELIGWVSGRVDRLDLRLTEQARDVAQNIRELNALAEHLAGVERSHGAEG